MTDKSKLNNNFEILIAGRQIEFVTGYSVDECVKQLENIEKDDPRWIRVQTSRFGRGSVSARFHFTHYKKSKDMHGTFTPQADGTTLVEAKVAPYHWEIVIFLGFVLAFIAFIVVFSTEAYNLMGFGIFIPVILIIAYRTDKKHLHAMNEILSEALYIPPKPRQKRKS